MCDPFRVDSTRNIHMINAADQLIKMLCASIFHCIGHD